MLKEKILKVLKTGKKVSAAKLVSMVAAGGSHSVHGRISELRSDGHAIYTTKTKTGTFYQLGDSATAVALAYKMFGAEVFSK